MRAIFLFAILFVQFSSYAQVFNQNPPDIEWMKIDTQNFEIIFPKEVESKAQRVAYLLEQYYPFVTRSLEVKPSKISLILQNQTTTSNGFVTLAPRRSEWFMAPTVDPELGNTEWLKTLSIHEFRHVVQMYKTKRGGFNKVLRFLFGEIGEAVGVGLTLPMWFLEGDAVGIETALTNGGRGRLPLFERNLRALILSGKKFDLDQAIMRSYDYYLPNHYVFGYFYTSNLRNDYGDMMLSDIANESAKSSYWPLSFYNAHERLTGESFDTFFERTIGELQTEWSKKLVKFSPTKYQKINLKRRFGWTNYEYPQISKNNRVVALKSGFSYIPRFVEIDGKNERILFFPSPLSQEYPYKLRDNKVAFLEHELDPRWGNRDFTKLKVYDLEEDNFILEISNKKWRLAVLNNEANKIALVEWNESQEQSILVLNLSGEILNKIEVSTDEVITSLDWLNDNQLVYVKRNIDDEKWVEEISLSSEEVRTLYAKSFSNLGYISVSEGQILLESPKSGIDNIYQLKDGNLYQLTSSSFGAYAPVIKNNKLFYNEYTADGMDIALKEGEFNKNEPSQDSFYPVYERILAYEGKENLNLVKDIPKSEVKKYSQFKNALNFHSWVLLAPPLSSSISFTANSQDLLNKFRFSAGALYNLNEKTFAGATAASWSYLYPVFNIGAAYTGRKQDIIINGVKKERHWEEGVFTTGMQIPWAKLSGRFVEVFTVKAFTNLIKVTNRPSYDPEEIGDSSYYSPGASAFFSFSHRMNTRDLLPALGMSLNAHFEEGKSIGGERKGGSLANLDSRLYLPGFWHHHSINQQFAYERQNDSSYRYASMVFYPRGANYLYLNELTKYSVNYTMPLFYPDVHLSRYVFLKRISFNVFYDELRGRYNKDHYLVSSTGWEILNETYFLRIPFPISWGIRGSYMITGKKDKSYELFLSQVLGAF